MAGKERRPQQGPHRWSETRRATGVAANACGTVADPGDEAAVPRLRIRMYRHGLGDCLLLRFRRDDGDRTFNILIDCGLITVAENPKETMIKVAEDIRTICDSRLDVVVMTHEHWDHASGFSEQQARSVFADMTIEEVWYGWTEDPQNTLGHRLRKEREQKTQALASAVTALGKMTNNPAALDRARDVGALLGFFGLDLAEAASDGKIGKTRAAFEYLLKRKDVRTRYCAPGKPPMQVPDVPVRIYVLGPPQDEGLIKRSSPTKKGREVYEMASEGKLASNLEAAFLRLGDNLSPDAAALAADCPFDVSFRRVPSMTRSSALLDDLLLKSWDKAGEEWRKIEDDWTQVAETLALNLDTHTNNTCLVLAFEFTATGEVFLFPADAQVGNWLSWQDCRWKVKTESGPVEVTGADLLERTVFYKVGHHGSHNATLRALGLELMTHEDLIAYVPVFRAQAKKNRWMGMPFNPLVKRLLEKTGGRLLMSDQDVPSTADLTGAGLPEPAQKRFHASVKADGGPDKLWFEYSVR